MGLLDGEDGQSTDDSQKRSTEEGEGGVFQLSPLQPGQRTGQSEGDLESLWTGRRVTHQHISLGFSLGSRG